MARLIDVSHVVEDGLVTYPGLPAPIVCDYPLARGLARRLCRGHHLPDRQDRDGRQYRHLHRLALPPLRGRRRSRGARPRVPGRPARGSCSTPRRIEGRAIDAAFLEGQELARQGGAGPHRLGPALGHPVLFQRAPLPNRCRGRARCATRSGLVGIDSLNIDDTRTARARSTRSCSARASRSPSTCAIWPRCRRAGFRFHAVPVKFRGVGTFPVRAYGVVR